MMCVVLKQFEAKGETLQRNQLVDVPEGIRLRQLVEQRMLRVATQEEIDSAVDVKVEEEPPPSRPPKPTVKKRRR